MGEATAAGHSPLEFVLPEYEFLGELGRGAMGVVLSARHRTLGRLVAVKELPPAFAADEVVRNRFLQEGQTLAGLDHPHVVVVHDFIDRDGHLALIMEQLAGGTVWDLFTTAGVTARVACGLMLSVASGLDHAHQHQVLHRDVKPENLLFTTTGQLKVTDFGMAKVMGGERTLATAEGVVLGTPAYMSPEQAEGAAIGPQTDVYACGTMLHELLCGRLPFADANTAVAMLVARVRDDAPPLLERAPHVPPAVAQVVDVALARDRDRRYATAEEFAVALGQAAASSWGTEWLAATGVTVTGSATIERASRASLRSPGLRPSHGGQARQGIHGRAPAPDTVIDLRPEPSQAQPAIRGSSAMRLPSPDLLRVAPEHMVDLSLESIGITRPQERTSWRRRHSPVLWLAALFFSMVAASSLATAFVAAGPRSSASGLALNGVAVMEEPVALDLEAPVVVNGLPAGSRVRMDLSFAGMPLGVAEADLSGAQATFAPAYFQWTTAGVVDAAFTVDGLESTRRTVAVAPTHRWWATAPAALVALLGAFGFASATSNVKGLRRGTAIVGPAVGLGLAVAVLTVSASGLLLLWLQVRPALQAVGLAAAAAGAAATLAALTRRRRQRMFVTTWA